MCMRMYVCVCARVMSDEVTRCELRDAIVFCVRVSVFFKEGCEEMKGKGLSRGSEVQYLCVGGFREGA